MFITEHERGDGVQWVNATDAARITLDSLGGMMPSAWEFLIRRAASDLILTKCTLIKSFRQSGRGVPFERKDALISYEFWEEFEHRGARTIQDWRAGDFERTKTDRWGDRDIVKVIDVQFSRQDLAIQLPSSNSPSDGNAGPEKLASARPPSQDAKALARLSDAALNSWWEWQDDQTRALGHDELWSLCQASFPRHTISRERVRALDSARKRGPKPIR